MICHCAEPDCYECFPDKPCDHEGHVHKGRCERCGERGLESDEETYRKEAP